MKCIWGKKSDTRKTESCKNNILRFIEYAIEKKIWWFSLCLAAIGIQAVMSVVTVYIPRGFVVVIQSCREYPLRIVFMTVVIQLLFCILKVIASWVRGRFRIKSNQLYCEAYEDMGISQSQMPYDKFMTAQNMEQVEGGKYGIWQLPFLSSEIEKLGSCIAILILNGIVLAIYDWKYILIPAIVVFLLKPLYQYQTKIELDNARRLLPENRAFGWYCKLISDFRYGEDLRVYQGETLIEKRCSALMEKIYQTNQTAFSKKGLCLGIVKFLIQFQIVLFSIFIVLHSMQKMSVEDFVLLFSAICAISTACNEIIEKINSIKKFDAMLTPFFQLLDNDSESDVAGEEKQCFIHKLQFDHVTFTYPEKSVPALQDVNFTIFSGEKVGIVGMNGAGKSTIVKLICKFYTPQSGRILIDDKDINEINKQEYQDILTALFQDYQLLPVTILENIAGKPIEQLASREVKKSKDLISRAGLDSWVTMLETKENTFLTPALSEKYVSPSGGQAQCIAMLRALYKNSAIAIFDEPTMALDSGKEEIILEMLMELNEKQICLMVSHRLSHVKLMDRILVLENGKIVEEGAHGLLMQKDGLYRKMYTLQAEKYGVKIEMQS